MRTTELNEVLAFDRSDLYNPIFDPELRLSFLEDVLTLCSSLITVSDKSITGPDISNIESLEVRLAHNSVKDYLISSHIKSGPSAQFFIEEKLAHSVMASCCLVYLLQLTRYSLDSMTSPEILLELPLILYAAQFWTEHYCQSDGDLLDPLALQFLTAENAYRYCYRLYNPNWSWLDPYPEDYTLPPPLYYASLMGLARMIIPLVANGANPNELVSYSWYGTALGAAAYKGHKDCVQGLLNASANPDVVDGDAPISWAASQGHNEIVALLLQTGADIDYADMFGANGPALFEAVGHGHSETAKMLVNAGANVHARVGMSGTFYAIELAAERGDHESMCLLFPKVSSWLAKQALYKVADAGHRELFEILLKTERGRAMGLGPAVRAGWNDLVQSLVDGNQQKVNIESSATEDLCEAAATGSLETVQILYENRVENSVSADELSNAIASASCCGYSLVVKYLLDRGANTENRKCQEALVEAAEYGHLSTVQVLLTAGVSSNSYYEDTVLHVPEKKSCLWAAVDKEHVEVARLLLAFGADPNTRYREMTALATSIEKANEELFELLLEKGASEVTIQTELLYYDMLALPVHYAASVGNVHVLRRLLEAGFEADNTLIADGWTALFHAAKAGHEKVLRILIDEYQVDVNQRANKGTVAIHTAAYHNHDKCVGLFLDAGVDVDVRGRAGRTALYWAAQQGSIDAVRCLLERGADVSIEDEDTGMKAADIARAKALEVLQSQKSNNHWKMPLEENYEPIFKMLMDQAARSQHTSNESNSIL
jgi:ankyrin repeat protein